MYDIYVDDLLIHSDITPLETCKVLDPHLTMEDCAAGSLEFTIPPGNVGYDAIHKLTSDVIVYENEEEIWRGRCISENMDFWKNKKYVIEGALAFLNDTVQPPREFNVSNTTVRSFLETLIATHNTQAPANRRFKVGMVTVDDGDSQADSDAIHRYTNYESTLECINEKLVNKLKGHITVKREFDTTDNTYKFTINYVKNYIDAHEKEIRFGMNLLDYAQSYEVTDLVTAIVPRGARLDESPISALEAYTTVASCGNDGTWHTSGSIFVTNQAAIETYGFICGVVDWDNVTDPNNLLTKAKQYLQKVQWNKLCLEVSVLDLHYLDSNADTFKLLQEVRCVSEPHGMDTFFPVTKMEIDLANPANTTFTLGTDYTPSLTSATSKVNTNFLSYLNSNPSEHAVLKSAKENAKALVMGTADDGYAGFFFGTDQYGNLVVDPNTGDVLHPYSPTGLRVANAATDDNSTKRWIWTYGGLMYQERVTNPSNPNYGNWGNPKIAMTMNGEIVADRITVGILKAINNYYQINTQTGYIQMEWAKLGPWYLNYGGRGLTDGTSAWIAPNDISCGNYGSLLIGLRCDGREYDGSRRGYLEVGVNDYQKYGDNCDGVLIHYNTITRHNGSESWVVWDNGSDEQLKEDIESLDIEEAKKIIFNVDPLTFRYKKGDKTKHYGFTAQRVERNCEELGLEDPFVVPLNEKDLKTIEYTQFIAPLIKVVQEQQKEIEELKATLQNKEKQNG